MGFIVDAITSLLQRTRWERVLVPPPDHTKHLEKLGTMSLPPETPEEKPPEGTREQLNVPEETLRRATGSEMLDYQMRELYGELWLLEAHLSNGCRIDGKLCDCCAKHALGVRKLARETQTMDQNPLWAEIASYAEQIYPKVLDSVVATRAYEAEYPGMVRRARELRKRIPLGQVGPEERAHIEEKAVAMVKEELTKL